MAEIQHTREPSHPSPNRSEALPISIGDALPDVLREIARRQSEAVS